MNKAFKLLWFCLWFAIFFLLHCMKAGGGSGLYRFKIISKSWQNVNKVFSDSLAELSPRCCPATTAPTASTASTRTAVAATTTRTTCFYLQHDGYYDEGEHERVEGMVLLSHLQDVLELRGVGRQQRHVQHPLRDRLLRRIAVGVQTL